MFEKLVAILPKIRTVFGLVGLIVAVGGYAATRQVAPESVPAQVAAGAVGVNLIVFGQIFYFLRLIPSAQRAKLIFRLFVVFCILTLLLLGTAIYAAAAQRFRVITPSVRGSGVGASTVPTTADNLEVTWTYDGQPDDLRISVVEVGSSTRLGPFKASASDRSLLIPANALRPLWPTPALGDRYRVRLEFQSRTHLQEFGPFEVSVALLVTYFYDDGEVTVASMTEPVHRFPHEFRARVVAWPLTAASNGGPHSVEIVAHDGVGRARFPAGFAPDAQTMKCAYFGTYPTALVRYRNLNSD